MAFVCRSDEHEVGEQRAGCRVVPDSCQHKSHDNTVALRNRAVALKVHIQPFTAFTTFCCIFAASQYTSLIMAVAWKSIWLLGLLMTTLSANAGEAPGMTGTAGQCVCMEWSALIQSALSIHAHNNNLCDGPDVDACAFHAAVCRDRRRVCGLL